ncbi:MAG: hypothetical protein AAF253_05960 [Pseudomonadota bacterium]
MAVELAGSAAGVKMVREDGGGTGVGAVLALARRTGHKAAHDTDV